jgi:nucleotide-binding universal stress UspA family protein
MSCATTSPRWSAGRCSLPSRSSRRPGERDAAHDALEELAGGLPAEDVECAVLDPAPVAARLDELAANRSADLLVVGSRGCGALRTAVEGSVSNHLLRTATCPLVVVPPAAPAA